MDDKGERRKVLAAADKLFSEGDVAGSVYFVMSGVLSGYKTNSNGKVNIAYKIFAGELIGELLIEFLLSSPMKPVKL